METKSAKDQSMHDSPITEKVSFAVRRRFLLRDVFTMVIAIAVLPFTVLNTNWLTAIITAMSLYTITICSVQLWYQPRQPDIAHSTTSFYNLLAVHLLLFFIVLICIITVFIGGYGFGENKPGVDGEQFLSFLLLIIPLALWLKAHRYSDQQLNQNDVQFLLNPAAIMAIPLGVFLTFGVLFIFLLVRGGPIN